MKTTKIDFVLLKTRSRAIGYIYSVSKDHSNRPFLADIWVHRLQAENYYPKRIELEKKSNIVIDFEVF